MAIPHSPSTAEVEHTPGLSKDQSISKITCWTYCWPVCEHFQLEPGLKGRDQEILLSHFESMLRLRILVDGTSYRSVAVVNFCPIVDFITPTLWNKRCCIVSWEEFRSVSDGGPFSQSDFAANGDGYGRTTSNVEVPVALCNFLTYMSIGSWTNLSQSFGTQHGSDAIVRKICGFIFQLDIMLWRTCLEYLSDNEYVCMWNSICSYLLVKNSVAMGAAVNMAREGAR